MGKKKKFNIGISTVVFIIVVVVGSIFAFMNIDDIIPNKIKEESDLTDGDSPVDTKETFGSFYEFTIKGNSEKELDDDFLDLDTSGNNFRFVGTTNEGVDFDKEYENYRVAFGEITSSYKSTELSKCVAMNKIGKFPDYQYFKLENFCEEDYVVSFYY